MKYEGLKLDNQLCFRFYAVSRLMTKAYQPYLDELGITYPQYLVLMVLWEEDGITVNEIAKRLLLNTNTVTPLLKRMEQDKILNRKKSEIDERKVIVSLSDKGSELKGKALHIPQEMGAKLLEKISLEELLKFRSTIDNIINMLQEEE